MSGKIGLCAQIHEDCICETKWEDTAKVVGVLEWEASLFPGKPTKIRRRYKCLACFLNRANQLLEMGTAATITVPQHGGGDE